MSVQSLEQTINGLADKVMTRLRHCDLSQRVIIGICGVPGSGKSTLAAAVASRINEIYVAKSEIKAPLAVVVPMDGFHLTRAQLSGMPKPDEAHHRRGAAFTFDGEGFYSLIRRLADSKGSRPDQTVLAPSFDHAVKDPVADTIFISPDSRIVLVEGNYCGLDRRPWSDAAELMTELWYIDCPRQIAHKRLSRRHLESGIVRDEQTAWARAQGTDELNAEDIRNNLLPMDEVVVSG